MYKSDFDPYGQRKRKFNLFPKRAENPVVIALQLFIIFLVVRFAMIVGGMMFVRIPVVDDLLVKVVKFIPK